MTKTNAIMKTLKKTYTAPVVNVMHVELHRFAADGGSLEKKEGEVESQDGWVRRQKVDPYPSVMSKEEW